MCAGHGGQLLGSSPSGLAHAQRCAALSHASRRNSYQLQVCLDPVSQLMLCPSGLDVVCISDVSLTCSDVVERYQWGWCLVRALQKRAI